MASEKRKTKDRTCRECGNVFVMNAKEIKAHALLCKRAQMAGLVLPGTIVRPKIELIGG